jgi:radical SAM protein with 4Fe4S-binding SPASM domain
MSFLPYVLQTIEIIFSLFLISHIGDVYPSGLLPVKAGNVRETPLADIYRHSPIFQDLRNPDKYKGKCGACEFRFVCGGSRSRAYAVTGDYLESEPFCVYIPKALRKEKRMSISHKQEG